MRTILALLATLALAIPALAQVGSPLPSTAYTRQLLRSADAAAARAALELVTGGVSNNWVGSFTGNGAGLTNLLASGSAQTNISYTAVTNAPWISNNQQSVTLPNATLSSPRITGGLLLGTDNSFTGIIDEYGTNNIISAGVGDVIVNPGYRTFLSGTNYFGGTDPTNSAIVISDRVQFRNIAGNGTNVFYVDPATGTLLWNTDGVSDIGGNGANRPRTIYSKGFNCNGDAVVTGTFYLTSRTYFSAPVLGSLRVSHDFGTAGRDRIYINGPAKSLTDNVDTGVITITARTNSFVGGTIDYTIYSTDGTDKQAASGIATYSGVNSNGVWYSLIATNNAANDAFSTTSAGSLATTWSMTAAATGSTTNVTINVNANTSLTPTSLYILWQLRNNGTNTITAAP